MERDKIINRRLLEYFGRAPNSDNIALFRVIWSEGLLETRKGIFEKYYGNIYLGTYSGIREAKKYSWVRDRWILEVYSGSNVLANDIIKQGDGYEAIWIFNKDEKYQELWWPAVEYLCKQWIANIIHPERKNDKIVEREHNEAEAKEINQIMESLEISTPLQLAFRKGVDEAVLLPGKEWEK